MQVILTSTMRKIPSSCSLKWASRHMTRQIDWLPLLYFCTAFSTLGVFCCAKYSNILCCLSFMAAAIFSRMGTPVSSVKCWKRPCREKRYGQSSFSFEMLCGGSQFRSRRWRMYVFWSQVCSAPLSTPDIPSWVGGNNKKKIQVCASKM